MRGSNHEKQVALNSLFETAQQIFLSCSLSKRRRSTVCLNQSCVVCNITHQKRGTAETEALMANKLTKKSRCINFEGENNAAFMHNIWYFETGNCTGFEFNSQVAFFKPWKKTNKRCVSKKPHDGQNECTVLVWRACVLSQPPSPVKWGCTAPGWQWCRLGALRRQPGISLSPDLAFDLSPSTSASSSIASWVCTQQVSSAKKVLYRSFRRETTDGPLLW